MAAHNSPPTHSRKFLYQHARTLALLAVPLVATPFLVGAASSDAVPSAAAIPDDRNLVEPTNNPPAQAPLELDEPATVTLITGDKVTVHPGGSVDTEPGPGRAHITFDEQNLGDQISVVPSDAAQLLAGGKLDERLFDITYLVREGYDDAHRDDMPLIVEGSPAPVRELATGPGSRVKRESAKLKMSTVARDKRKDKGQLWTRVTDRKDAPVSLPAGVDKVWLDGTVHVTLDESVPQIGAPEVWDAGYTGEGVTVAVLDTGIDTTHPDLTGKVAVAEAFTTNVNSGAFEVTQMADPLSYLALSGARVVPKEETSDPLVYVGRACVESEGDELAADPEGKTALIVRDQSACPFAEKFDAVVGAGATGVVIFNDEPGLFRGLLEGAEHGGEAWGASISDADGAALVDLLAANEDVVLEFTDQALIGDVHGHGTHVASTIAGTGAASDGARAGVAPDAKLISGQVCNEAGSCQDSWVMAGMEWAVENGADVVNMSLGGGATDGTDPLSQAVNTITDSHDVLFVVAAGNAGGSGSGFVASPGVADAALTVGAVDRDDKAAWFSSRGPRLPDHAVKPEISAPGWGIVAARAANTALGAPVDDDYTASSGTSMATPHVAGAAALLVQARPELDAPALKNALASTAADAANLWVEQGSGRIDVARAVSQGIYADASVNFGNVGDADEPVERQITYINHTDRPIVLQLQASITSLGRDDATDGLRISRQRLTVRPHRDATIKVTLDPSQLNAGPGPYGGVVTATGNSVSLRTAVGFGLQLAVPPLTADWGEEWTATYQYADGDWPGWANGMRLSDATMSPDGARLFLFGAQEEAGAGAKVTTAAVDASTGEQVWVAHHAVPDVVTSSRIASAAVSPDGSTVVVSHDIWDEGDNRRDSLTLAYNNAAPQQPEDPELGELLWQASYQDMGLTRFHAGHGVTRVAVTPDNKTVLMVATKATSSSQREIHTVAYDVGSGGQIWFAVHRNPGLQYFGRDIAVSPSGDLAYVTGFEQHEAGVVDVSPVTIAYALDGESQGEQRWIARHDSFTGNYQSWHNTMSADGKRVFVTATIQVGDRNPFDERMQTLAYDAPTGELLWSAQFGAADHGYGPGHTEPSRWSSGSMTVDPTNDLVLIAGKHCEGSLCEGRKTTVLLAYDQEAGDLVWSQLEQVQASGRADLTDFLKSIAVSPDGSRVYASGSVGPFRAKDQLTLAYDAATGERIAVARHDYTDGIDGDHEGQKTFISPDGSNIYTVTSILPPDSFASWGVAAYPSPITLTTNAYRSRGTWLVDMSWSGITSDQVDVYRDDDAVATVNNSGSYTDDLGKQPQGSTFTYKVCVAGTAACSKEVNVEIGMRQSSRRATAPI